MNVRKIGLLLLACCAVVGVSAQSTSALRINEVLTNNVNNYVDPFGTEEHGSRYTTVRQVRYKWQVVILPTTRIIPRSI